MKKTNKLSLKNILLEKKSNNLTEIVKEKNIRVQNIIRDTIVSIKSNKPYDIFSNNDIALSLNILNDLYKTTVRIDNAADSLAEESVELLQKTIDKLSMVICGFGTKNIDDLLFISFGSEYVNMNISNELIKEKYDLIRKHIHPTGYKITHWKSGNIVDTNDTCLCSNKITENVLYIEKSFMFECFDIDKPSKTFYQKMYGIRVVIQNPKAKKTLIIHGLIDDIQIECFTNGYIKKRVDDLIHKTDTLEGIEKEVYKNFVESLTFKEILIYGDEDVYKKMISVFTETNIIKNNKLNITIKRFLEMDTYNQRNLLVNLLINNSDHELQYICYLLYDLISIHSMDSGSENEQIVIYDSFPWKLKDYFKDVIKFTIQYTNEMSQKYDINKISLEQQVYLLKVDDNVKEKAMAKLKEVKTKSDEMGIKAKQYLEGLIKIPFGIYKEEPILKEMNEMNQMFSKLSNNITELSLDTTIDKKDKYTNAEILRALSILRTCIPRDSAKKLTQYLTANNNKTIDTKMKQINAVLAFDNKNKLKLRSKETRVTELSKHLESARDADVVRLYDFFQISHPLSMSKVYEETTLLCKKVKCIENSMNKITDTLNESIHGHSHAKNQILKIIAQWMNGERSGYSFGFEGSPGIGKTSLAKRGLANCLKDENGEPRPYSFIALGGSSNGKTLEGHGYTYVHSNWGKIVDILIDSKCMNPIIYIDELDKVSKTEEGKEIIGILIHLIDQTQNDVFQDRYFSGINIDLSKALFIFSYNDPEQIDKILLDRIHRIKFDNLSVEDKITIANKYLLPEINKKMGFNNTVEISGEIIQYIIETYTCESGVRKLKEVIFDLFGEINIELLRCTDENLQLPIQINKDILRNKYLKKYNEIKHHKINNIPSVGVINGLWANSLGMGGVLPIESMLCPSETFLELKLTGLQGDVMKESMNVAKTLAWNLTDNETKKKWVNTFQETKCQGLHIHCPEGAVSKDGPSAGAAITTVIYSLLNNKRIKNDVAITGEINLQGKVMAIGGLKDKFLGAIKSGIKVFLYPEDNIKDFEEFKENYKDANEIPVEFKAVRIINDVFESVFVE
jgi:ATP-dependent Lon protease